MSRNRAMNWTKAQQEARAVEERTSGPSKVFGPAPSPLAGWQERSMRYETRCQACNEPIIVGETALMKRNYGGRSKWLFRHVYHEPPS